MNRWMLAGLAALLAMSIAPASHATGGGGSGTLRVGINDGMGEDGDEGILAAREEARSRGISQLPLQCSTTNPLNGIDQQWYNVSAHRGHSASIVPTGVTGFTSDFDGWFFDASCAFIVGANMAEGAPDNSLPGVGQAPSSIPFTQMGDPEFGTVPSNATWMVVVLYQGANATFTVAF